MDSDVATVTWNPTASDEDPIRELTDALDCVATTVHRYHIPADERLDVDPGTEHLCVPGNGTWTVNGTQVPRKGLARIPAGTSGHLAAQTSTTVLVIGAATDADSADGPVILDVTDRPFRVPATSDIRTAHLTDALGCTGMKVNARALRPGQHVPYHTEGSQEELFVPIRGPASMRIDETVQETPIGSITRVAPDVPRSVRNDGDEEALWVMVGAPPTGDSTGWDPGAEILED